MTKVDLLQADSHEALDALTIEHAKYFTVVQTYLGRFSREGVSNYNREEVPTLEAARKRAKELHEETGKKSMIYAVADFVGADNFARHLENYPPTPMPFKEKKTAADRRIGVKQVKLSSDTKPGQRHLP